MVARLRRFLDIRPGEGFPVLLTFTYIAVVIAAYVLARAIRNGLFIEAYGPYALVYVGAASPIVLSLFVPAYTALAARLGPRRVTAGALLFFSLNVVVIWWAFRVAPSPSLTAIFYVWVNCFGVIAPVHAWSYASSLFDTRQAKRLFGLIGSGASLGAIVGGLLARVLARPMGGSIDLLLILALLIALGSAVVVVANVVIRRHGEMRIRRPSSEPLRRTVRTIAGRPYLRLIAATVVLTAIVTQWTGFQLSLVTAAYFDSDATALTRFNGTFSLALGIVSFLVQIFATSQALRRFGLAVTILALPLSLGFGTLLIVLVPAFWPVILTNAFDQGLRFSVDRPTYELLYLPIAPAERLPIKTAIDIVGSRMADAVGAVVYGTLTIGFLGPGLGLGLRGTALANLGLIAAWSIVALRLRAAYVRTIQESIHRHRMDTERTAALGSERTAADALRDQLAADDPSEVRYALSLLEGQRTRRWDPALRALLRHPAADVRQRALALLATAGDLDIGPEAIEMLRDPDLGVRTEALLYLSRERGLDPLLQVENLGDFSEFSIRAGMAAFLAGPGPQRNLEAALALLEKMASAQGPEGVRERAEAARLIALAPDAFVGMLPGLVADDDAEVARHAIETARGIVRDETVEPLLAALARPEVSDEAAGALARFGSALVPVLAQRIDDERTPLEVRRELPSVLARIGTPEAEQLLVGSLLHADTVLRHRVIASLNKLRVMHPEVPLDPAAIELLLAAEIAGHYRSYQILGPLKAGLRENGSPIEALESAMDLELERIFRVMALLLPHAGLHDAYVGLQSASPVVRANAIEFLDNVLRPELRQLLVPLLDSQVTMAEKIALADRLVGAPLETPQQAIATLLASEDAWLRSCAVYAIGAMQLDTLEPELDRFEDTEDPALRQTLDDARRRLARAPEPLPVHEPAPASLGMGVGAG